jgi:DNA-binding SARP family transcriptional activator/tetratricopeptide (TPR) repeat protein
MAARRIPAVIDGYLHPAPEGDQHDPIVVGSVEWFGWLDEPAHKSFSFRTEQGAVTVRREQKRYNWYWYAYHAAHGKLCKAYVGRSTELSATHLESVATRLLHTPHEPSAPSLRLYLLGSPTIERGGTPLPPLSTKAMATLAYLAAHERPVARAHVLALLWPESNEQAAHKNLRNTLWLLRRELGHDTVVGGEHLQLGTSAWVDVRMLTGSDGGDAEDEIDVEAMQRGGEFLEGVTLGDAPDFELWLATMREHYHDLILRRLLALVARLRAARRWDEVIVVARRALSRDALQEPVYQLLMEAYAMQGDRAAALRQYDVLRDTLERELGVAPLPESDALRDDIIRGTLQPAASTVVARLPPTSTRSAPAQPFAGRAHELAALDAAWALARTGVAQVALLSGEAGIGKSRLWQIWSKDLDTYVTVLGARCLAPTQQLPFAPLVDMLRAPSIRERLARATKGTPPPNWLSHIARLVPELHDLRPGLPPVVSAEDEQRHVFEALVLSLGITPDQPVALFIDDLHWADRATLDWLGYLLHRAECAPLLMVGTYRSDEAQPALLRLETAWKREGILHDVPLRRLSREEAETIVAAMEGGSGRADALYQQSAGNPFFLLELLRADPGVVPSTLTDLIERRLERLSATARQVLHAAAVLQEEIVFDVLQHTSGRTAEETLDALDALLAAQLLAEQDQHFVFSHPLIAFVADQGLSGARRVMLHRRAAAALLRDRADHAATAGRLARHYIEAQEYARAAHYAECAGDQALAVAAPTEAAQFYQQALALEWTAPRAHGLGRARYHHGDVASARSAYEAAIQGYERDGEHALAARAAVEMALTFFADNQLAEVVRWAQQGRDYLGEADDNSTRALMLYLLGAEKRNANASLDEAAASLAESSRLLAEHDAMGLLPSVLLELGNTRAEQGDVVGAVETFRELVHRAQQTGSDFNQALGYNNLAYHLLLLGDHAAAREAVEAGIAVAHERDVPLAFPWLWSTSGESALVEGRWDAATTAFERAIVAAERYGNDEHVASCRVSRAIVEGRRGNVAAARQMLEEIRTAAARLAMPYLDLHLAYWLAVFTPATERDESPDDVLSRAAHTLRPGEVARLRRWLQLVHGAGS